MRIHSIRLGLEVDRADGDSWKWGVRLQVVPSDHFDHPAITTVERALFQGGKLPPNFVLPYTAEPCIAVPRSLWGLLDSGLGMRVGAVTCRKCGAVGHASETTRGPDMLRLRFCASCLFWLDRAKRQRKDPSAIIVDGSAYTIGEELPKHYGGFRGFGGARFHIRFPDGREVITFNLWCQGTVPPHWRSFLPDTAVFVREPRPVAVFDPNEERPQVGGSREPTPWAVICPKHGRVYLNEAEYSYQLGRADHSWECTCGARAEWDEENYEAAMERDDATNQDF